MDSQDRYGINMKQYIILHEKYIEEEMKKPDTDMDELIAWHDKKLTWLMHERLVHLIVTVMTTFLWLFCIGVTFFPVFQPYLGLLTLGIMILLFFYYKHYFLLENSVQHWYRIAEELRNR